MYADLEGTDCVLALEPARTAWTAVPSASPLGPALLGLFKGRRGLDGTDFVLALEPARTAWTAVPSASPLGPALLGLFK